MVNLSVLEDLVAVEDVADLEQIGPMLRWLDGHGLLDLRRLRTCQLCRGPFVCGEHGRHQKFCSVSCRQKAYAPVWHARNPGKRSQYDRTWKRNRAGRRAAA